MITAIIQEKKYQLPQSWNEMSNSQLEFLSVLLREKVTPQEVKLKMLMHSLSLKYDWRGRLRLEKKVCPIDTEDLYLASQVFDFLFAEDTESKQTYLDVRLTRCPFPTFNDSLQQVFQSAGDALTDATYEQYLYLSSIADAMQDNEEVKADFYACLYSPANESFSKDKARPDLFENLPKEQLQLLEWYWLGSVRYLADRFPALFSGGSADNDSTNVYQRQERLLDMLSDGDVSKKNAYKKDNLYSVLSAIEYLIEKQERNEKIQS